MVTINASGINTEIKVNGQKLETVTSFKYLGSVITDEGSEPEIIFRIAQTTAACTSLEWQEYLSQLQDTTDALPYYIHLPVCLWIMDPHSRAPQKNTSHGKQVLAQDTTHLTQRPCYQGGSPCQDPTDNWTTRRPDDRKETQTAAVGHVSSSAGLAKTISQGTVKGGRRQGRQRKRWEDSIREWTGLEFPKSQRAVETRKKWRKLVTKSSVVPERPLRLRDRWWWWWWWWYNLASIFALEKCCTISPVNQGTVTATVKTNWMTLWRGSHLTVSRSLVV